MTVHSVRERAIALLVPSLVFFLGSSPINHATEPHNRASCERTIQHRERVPVAFGLKAAGATCAMRIVNLRKEVALA
jgi:hypothetical protein